MYAASPALRGDAGSVGEVLPGLPLALLSEETLADQFEMRGLGTARASTQQNTCADPSKLAPPPMPLLAASVLRPLALKK